jgi:hypothetical protein
MELINDKQTAMSALLDRALAQLSTLEAAFIRQHLLNQPHITYKDFAKAWRVPEDNLPELRKSSLANLESILYKHELATISELL